MHEYVTKAVVLDKTTRSGEADARYSFFTERYGKIAARATSSRKIVSKLAGHLEPGTVSAVRIIEQRGTRVVDALKITRLPIAIADLASLNNLLGEWEPDAALWNEFRRTAVQAKKASGIASVAFWRNTLAILGWDPQGAVCANCERLAFGPGGGKGMYFYIPRQEYFCAECAAAGRASRFAPNDLILV